jgi:steroid 5-alpha reductase family enzyme
LSAFIHFAIPVVAYQIMNEGFGTKLLSKLTTVIPLSPGRKALYMFLNVFYSIRWVFGMMTMNTHITLDVSIFVTVIHMLFREISYIVASMAFFGAPYDLTTRGYIAASLMVLGGTMQHGAEAQRWLFKRRAENKGKLHTSGLFGLARGINHTGHVIRDLASCLFAPNPLLLLYLFADYGLLFGIFPKTVEHTKTKYGEKYEAYAKATPSLLVPGVY